MKIYKFKDFLVESIKDNMPDCGWKEITTIDYWMNRLKNEEFTEEELDYLSEFARKNNLSGAPSGKGKSTFIWNSGCSIRFENKERGVKIAIMKYEEEWFIVETTIIVKFDKPRIIEENYYIVDENGIRESDYGLKDLLNNIMK